MKYTKGIIMSINKCGSLTEQDLEIIYEITYKYGWLVSEERQEGWLGDRAVMEKFRIEEAVNEWMPYGLEGMLETYKGWLSGHTKEGWINQFTEQGYEISDIQSILEMWDITLDNDTIYEEVARSFGSDRDYLIEVEDADYLIELYAEDVVNYKIEQEEDEANAEKMQGEVDDIGHEEYFNKHINDIYTIIDWLIDEQGWTTKEHLQDVGYNVGDLLKQFGNNVDLHTLLEKAYQDYLDHFPGLDEEIEGIIVMKGKIENALNSDLQEQIITFQEGLTTAHHHGTMADHLLEVQAGSGVGILDKLSSGLNMDLWNRELEGVLGKQLFEE